MKKKDAVIEIKQADNGGFMVEYSCMEIGEGGFGSHEDGMEVFMDLEGVQDWLVKFFE